MLDGVLVVDDDQALRETLVSVLQFCGLPGLGGC